MRRLLVLLILVLQGFALAVLLFANATGVALSSAFLVGLTTLYSAGAILAIRFSRRGSG